MQPIIMRSETDRSLVTFSTAQHWPSPVADCGIVKTTQSITLVTQFVARTNYDSTGTLLGYLVHSWPLIDGQTFHPDAEDLNIKTCSFAPTRLASRMISIDSKYTLSPTSLPNILQAQFQQKKSIERVNLIAPSQPQHLNILQQQAATCFN